jgi:hypothetical protein
MQKKNKPFLLILFMILTGAFYSCKKFVTVSAPQTQLINASVFADDQSATSAMVGIYSNMMRSVGFASGGSSSITSLAGLSADELVNYSTDAQREAFYKNALTPTNQYILSSLWAEGYQYIYAANSIIEGVSQSTGLSASVKKQLLGEARFIRAFCHFYLVNLFGPIPYVTSTDYRINNSISRASMYSVYQNIIADLLFAQTSMTLDYSFSSGERVRPNAWTAEALLARVYLYTGNWGAADSAATAIINDNTDFELDNDLNQVFLANSSEAIWQLEPVTPTLNTNEGNIFILTAAPDFSALSDQVINAFDSGDMRKTAWLDSIIVSGITYYFPYKYKIKTGSPVSEYSMVFRLAEQFLIRAEAKVELGQSDAINDINAIRNRAGLPDYAGATDTHSLIDEIIHERQLEFFAEWGHRWFDLKRTGTVNTVLSAEKTSWQSTDSLYPIPQMQIQNDPNTSQNPGY